MPPDAPNIKKINNNSGSIFSNQRYQFEILVDNKCAILQFLI